MAGGASSLRAISAAGAGAGGRGVQGGARGRKGPREGGGRSVKKEERSRNGTGRMISELETETRKTAVRRTTAEQAHRGRGQEQHRDQIISDGEGGKYHTRGAGQEGSKDKSVDWSCAESE